MYDHLHTPTTVSAPSFKSRCNVEFHNTGMILNIVRVGQIWATSDEKIKKRDEYGPVIKDDSPRSGDSLV